MKHFSLSLWMVGLAVTLACCSSGQPKKNDTMEKNNSTAETSCPDKNTIEVRLVKQNSYYADEHPKIDWKIQKAIAYKTDNISTTYYAIYLANFDFTPASASEAVSPKLEEGQAVLQVFVTYHVKDSKEQGIPLPAGNYDVNKGQSPETGMTGAINIAVQKGGKFPISQGQAKGNLEIISAGDKAICGKIDLEDPIYGVKAEFTAAVAN